MMSGLIGRRLTIILIALICSLISIEPNAAEQSKDSAQGKLGRTPCDFVDPFIGTRDMGHTYPGATVPFGLVQLSPDTDTLLYSYGEGYNPEIYRYCSGYQYDDKTIVGFSHTHFSGTGHSDLGDFLLMPTTGHLRLNPGTEDRPETGYRSRYSHDEEIAHPGYYAVTLSDYGIDVELTATERTGFHRYRFQETEDAHIILDLTSGIYSYDGKVVWSSVRVENDTLVTGYRQTHGWARTRCIYFAMVFSKPIKSFGLRNDEELVYRGFWRKWDEDHDFPERAGRRIRGHFDFETKENEEILVKFALSGVSSLGALENLRSEIPHWDFDLTRDQAREAWNGELSRIEIEADEDRKVNFYTAMYHSLLAPVLYSDVSGEYRGLDQNVHMADGFNNYTIFSLWDTYRALHPLFTILQRERTNDMIRSMLAHYEQSVHGILPVWSHHSNDNWCMIGYHSVSVIVDAFMKGIRDYSVGEAFEAVVSSATYDKYDGIGYYEELGYVPDDLNTNSASKTLEYAYDDWTIFRFAEELGRKETFDIFQDRAASYNNLFDKDTGFIRAKDSSGAWKSPFDPLSTSGQGFIEGNAWNYSLYVPHDIHGLIELIGGNERFIDWLDSLFTMDISEESYSHSEDIEKVGIIGNYIHGNEPSHHIPYLYSYAGAPWKTQERIHQIVDSMYRNAPDGLCGNDDCGQMSAWYIFSSLGFYPVCPGSNEYVFGSPCLSSASIKLENGMEFHIRAENLGKENIYIQSIRLNGVEYRKSFIAHDDLMKGGELVFVMGSEPAEAWPPTRETLPYSMSR